MKSQITFPSLHPHSSSFSKDKASTTEPTSGLFLWDLPSSRTLWFRKPWNASWKVFSHHSPHVSHLFPTSVLSICLTVCCVLCTYNHALIGTVPPENKCWVKGYASVHEKTTTLPCRLLLHFERDTGKREENQDHENFRKPPYWRKDWISCT